MLRKPARNRVSRRQAHDPSDANAADLALTALLTRREYSTAEARENLLARGYEPVVVDQLLADYTDRHLLDDSRYAAHFVSSRSGRGQGPVRIRMELRDLGVAATTIEQALADGPDFNALCRSLRQRRFGTQAPTDWPEKAKQLRFLQYRGFSMDHIRSALGPDIELE